eukprot:scaffold231085_cov17-Tisochrysis_lutea.AAC.1
MLESRPALNSSTNVPLLACLQDLLRRQQQFLLQMSLPNWVPTYPWSTLQALYRSTVSWMPSLPGERSKTLVRLWDGHSLSPVPLLKSRRKSGILWTELRSLRRSLRDSGMLFVCGPIFVTPWFGLARNIWSLRLAALALPGIQNSFVCELWLPLLPHEKGAPVLSAVGAQHVATLPNIWALDAHTAGEWCVATQHTASLMCKHLALGATHQR